MASWLERVFRPRRPRLEEVRAAIGDRKPPEAMTALVAAGVSLEEPHRAYARFTTAKPPAPKPMPPTAELLVAIASDLDAVAACEQAALDFGTSIAGLFPGRKPATRIAWHATKSDGGHTWANGSGLYGGAEFLMTHLAADERKANVPDLAPLKARLTDWAYWHVAYVVGEAAIWDAAMRGGKTVPAKSESLLAGKPFTEIANPWAPLITILGHGYALTHREKDVLYLAVP